MLQQLQTRLQTIIAAAPLLAGRPVLVEDKGNLTIEVENALATQALAIVVAASSGQAKAGQLRGRPGSDEEFEVVIHRGLLDDAAGLTTIAVLDTLCPLLCSSLCDPNNPAAGLFAFKRHDLRENSDGSFCRVLVVTCPHTWEIPPPASSS